MVVSGPAASPTSQVQSPVFQSHHSPENAVQPSPWSAMVIFTQYGNAGEQSLQVTILSQQHGASNRCPSAGPPWLYMILSLVLL